ncbi:hypothetical protein HNR78_000578 [Parageobacillus toebii NBRC 107807]|uniref:Uncharacterized protein n=1 Tax=Parageobacillus toebii NBRC 107807 TaxID=1223503 RepID=A0AA89SR86_9BACL|nr:hypothetical protein [Parageobacillus toebii NBRC 107807]
MNLIFSYTHSIITYIKEIRKSDDEDTGVFLRFPEREGIGCNLPNTKNTLTTSELRQ